MQYDNGISTYKRQLDESLGEILTVMERAYVSFSRDCKDPKDAIATYYRLCGEMIAACQSAESVTRRISAAIQRADGQCSPETASALGALLEIYLGFRGVFEQYLSECECAVQIKDTPFPAHTLVHQTDILIRKTSMLKKDIQRI